MLKRRTTTSSSGGGEEERREKGIQPGNDQNVPKFQSEHTVTTPMIQHLNWKRVNNGCLMTDNQDLSIYSLCCKFTIVLR